jgi:hypothetical protein
MTNPQLPGDMATEMLRDLKEFERSGGKEAFLKQLREEFVLRSGAANLDQALGKAMAALLRQTVQTGWLTRKRVARSPSGRKASRQAHGT